MSENKHLTLDERNFIEQELAKNTSFREIAKYLGKDPTTISKEVRKHRIKKEGQAIHVNFNHCAKNYACKLTKFYYRALPSFNKYKTNLSEARQGINLTEMELANLDRVVSPLIKKGQSLSHIHKTNDLPIARATLYNYVSKNCLSASAIDLPRKVRMRKCNICRKNIGKT